MPCSYIWGGFAFVLGLSGPIATAAQAPAMMAPEPGLFSGATGPHGAWGRWFGSIVSQVTHHVTSEAAAERRQELQDARDQEEPS